MYTWSAIESEGNLHKGVFGGSEESYSPSRQQQPFVAAAVRTDSDEAYESAVKKSADFLKKNPNMSIASVTTRPLNPNSSRKTLVNTLRDTVAGMASGSRAGAAMCAVMMASTPCSMAVLNGTNSMDSSR